MTWDTTTPTLATEIGAALTAIRANWDAIQAGTVPFVELKLYKHTLTPTFVADYGFIYTKNDGTHVELNYMDETGTITKLTENGALIASQLTAIASQDLLVTAAAGQDIITQLGDNAGANGQTWNDSDGNPIYSLDSNGNVVTYANITAKIGDKGDAARVVNQMIPVAWAYVDNLGNLSGENLTVTGAHNSERIFTFAGYTPSDANYCIVANASVYSTALTFNPKTTGGFSIHSVSLITGSPIQSQMLNVVVYDK